MTVAYIPLIELFAIARSRGLLADLVVYHGEPYIRVCQLDAVEASGEEVPSEREARAA